MISKGEWEADGTEVTLFGQGIIAKCPLPSSDGVMDCCNNAQFIALAANVCQQINPDNPMTVLKALPDLVEACEAIKTSPASKLGKALTKAKEIQ